MKHLITSFAVAMLALPMTVSAQNAAAPNATPPVASANMGCPMMTGAPAMRQDMAGMMTEMQTMVKNTHDPMMKDRMQKMYERMSAMMVNMQQMGGMGGMMGNGMMGGQQPGAAKPESNAPASPDNHDSHHPEQQ